MSSPRFFVLMLVTAGFATVVSVTALQQRPCDEACGTPTAWQEFNSFTLRVTVSGKPGYYQWQGRFDKETHDIQIDVENSEEGALVSGKILMIGGRVMAMKGPIAKPGYELDGLDAAALELQLVMKSLGRALPDGPATVKSTQHVDYSDSKIGIKVATQSADAMIQAPWRVVGDLKHAEPDVVQYDLTLTSGDGLGKENTVGFSGRLFNSPNTRIDDKLSLENWKLFDVGPQSHKQGDSTIIGYGATATTVYRTVADVRKKVEADDYPGQVDLTKDFTGFWKTNCEDAFGLQIKHFGTDGKYSIVFCGPGGCDDPADSRLTFVTKDPNYQVISEDEIKEQTADGWETYHRCTRDTHPVLKYEDDDDEPASTAPVTGGHEGLKSEGQDWELVRSVPNEFGGTVDLVLIPEAKQRDRGYYKQVADVVCGQRTSCMVNFWTDRKHVPQTQTAWFPVSDLAVMTASYERSLHYKSPHLHLACWLYPNKAAGDADKCDYEPGAAKPPEK
jgi:hypothetical protein